MRVLLGLAILCSTMALAGGVSGRGGLEALAVSVDGKLLACGGQNRVVYLLEGETLTVTRRMYLGARIGGLAFSKDGGHLAIEDETDRLHLIEVSSGKTLAKLDRLTGMVATPTSNLIVVRGLANPAKTPLRFLSLDTFEEAGRVELPDRPAAWVLDETGKKLYVLSSSQRSEEPVVSSAEIPRESKGLARWLFRQKNDGLESELYEVEVPSGKILRTMRTWFTSDSDSTQLARIGAETFIYNRYNVCARIDARGETTLFETPQGVNQALGVSPSGKWLVTGGLAGGWHGPTQGGKAGPYRLETLPGQAEFINRLIVRDEGSAWGVTTASRIVWVGADGAVKKVVPVY